jgi:hypothetical protein
MLRITEFTSNTFFISCNGKKFDLEKLPIKNVRYWHPTGQQDDIVRAIDNITLLTMAQQSIKNLLQNPDLNLDGINELFAENIDITNEDEVDKFVKQFIVMVSQGGNDFTISTADQIYIEDIDELYSK